MSVLGLLVNSRRHLVALLVAVLLSVFVGAIRLHGQGCNKWTGVCQARCGSRSSTDCGDFPYTCQWEVCSQYAAQLDQYPILYTCYFSGSGYPYTDTCVTVSCGHSYCPCVGMGPCGPF